jgi:hypothetical protein
LKAQHIKLDKKVLSFLAIEDTINIVFSYKDVLFEGDNVTEEEFLKNHKTIKETHLGKDSSEDWVKNYYKYKDSNWPESFINTLNKKLSDYENSPIFVLNKKNAKYSMKVHTVWMYFGYNVIIGKEPSKVTMNLSFYETKTPNNEIYTTTISRAMGTNNESYNLKDWPSFRRVGKGFEKGAYKLAQAFKRIVD